MHVGGMDLEPFFLQLDQRSLRPDAHLTPLSKRRGEPQAFLFYSILCLVSHLSFHQSTITSLGLRQSLHTPSVPHSLIITAYVLVSKWAYLSYKS
jgi:hypothetical protein